MSLTISLGVSSVAVTVVMVSKSFSQEKSIPAKKIAGMQVIFKYVLNFSTGVAYLTVVLSPQQEQVCDVPLATPSLKMSVLSGALLKNLSLLTSFLPAAMAFLT